MKMHFLDGGRLRMKRKIFVPGADRDEPIELPVISTLFRHAKGNVLFDTGCHPSVNSDPGARWGGMEKFMTPIAPPKQDVIHALAEVGLKPEDIDIVVNSHLHPDHCGCNEFFTRAQFYCHEKELEAGTAEGAGKMGYLRAEWEHPMRLDTISGSLDVFDDSRLVTIHIPGHTPGLIGLRADLQHSGEFFIVSDAVALERNLDNDEAPLNAWNSDLLLSSYDIIRARRTAGATIICGHDDTQWQQLKTGLHAYD
ncbi:MAG: N-acyl homoserine lactonase family protein [Rhodobiaceae bacterium]|nr:N-acyl homoserine lactonase family protein [Rhodobiaceae bacterium]MCC0014563.1 N-acyl homoserine lactonase family protein [Rhodobiaceae bacterium]MCC0061356.1 N-acyl homoserine lactonase family protein [Rhodobiaceae bacterium]